MTKLEELERLRKENESRDIQLDNLKKEFAYLKKEINQKFLSLIDCKSNCDKLEAFLKQYALDNHKESLYNITMSIVDNDYCYNMTIYYNEINFEVVKDNVRIGNFYYWKKNRNGMGDIQICFDDINPIWNKGIVLEYLEDFILAFKNFFNNIDTFLKNMEVLYDNELIKEEKSLEINLLKTKEEEKNLKTKYDSWLKEIDTII